MQQRALVEPRVPVLCVISYIIACATGLPELCLMVQAKETHKAGGL
jgi:hypothetical protein